MFFKDLRSSEAGHIIKHNLASTQRFIAVELIVVIKAFQVDNHILFASQMSCLISRVFSSRH